MSKYYEGKMFVYNKYNCTAFQTQNVSDTVLIYLTGLGGTFFSEKIVDELIKFCSQNNISFCQPTFRSHPKFGLYTLQDDLEDFEQLMHHFKDKKVFLFGFSTGCQNIIYNLKKMENKYKILHAFLQAPVSDREYEHKINKQNLFRIYEKIKSKSLNYIFEYAGTIYTKERWLDLYFEDGKDDFFSSDLTDQFYSDLNPYNVPMSFLISENDEYVIASIIKNLEKVPNSQIFVVKGATHALSTKNDFKQLALILNKCLHLN